MSLLKHNHDDTVRFDNTVIRDINDLTVVKRLRECADNHGKSVQEIDRGFEEISDDVDFVFGWKNEFVDYFLCKDTILTTQGFTNQENTDESMFFTMLSKLNRLRCVRIRNCSGNIAWIESLLGLDKIIIDSMPTSPELFPSSLACLSSLNFLYLKYGNTSSPTIPDPIRELNSLRIFRIINCSPNSIKLPEWLGELPNLSELMLMGSFDTIPYSVVKSGLPFTNNSYATPGIVLARNFSIQDGDVSLYLSNNRDLIEDYYIEKSLISSIDENAYLDCPLPESDAGMEMETRDFFISYNNNHDGEKARWIADTLRINGYTVYFQDDDCIPGMDFLQWMEDTIPYSKGFIAVWSGAYEKSDYCKIELHAAIVRRHKKKNYLFLPVRVESTPIENPLFQSVVRVDLLSGDENANRILLLNAIRKLRRMK